MRINHNISSMVGQGSLLRVHRDMNKSLERLSTGLRINSAADDAAGLGVSENLRTQVRGLGQASKNAQDAIAMLNIADGALQEQTEILQRMRELVIQARNDTYTETERLYMGQEFSQLMDEIDRIAATTNYNGMQIFATPEKSGDNPTYAGNDASGTPHKLGDARTAWDNNDDSVFGADDNSSAHHFNMMIGANYTAEDAAAFNSGTDAQSYDKNAANMITIQFGQMDTNVLLSTMASFAVDAEDIVETDGNAFGWDATNDVYDATMAAAYGGDDVQSKFEYLLEVLDGDSNFSGTVGDVTGLERVNKMRAQIGAMTNRLEHALTNMVNSQTNQQSAESKIRDADFASESTQFTRNQILSSSATAMLAQSNMVPQAVLQLL
ncbi:MAG: hypothetical protein GF401_11205 [Chitinivibrionales bacterium]|nr:hypothetical protein [Chitinivibrionales bacterium]